MGFVNFKIPSKEMNVLKKITGEKTGAKAISKIIKSYMKLSNQRNIVKTLQKIEFHKDYDPIRLRKNDR